MRAVITGASSDISKLIMDHFDYDWTPISRTHGIKLPDDIEKVMQGIKSADLFFNIGQHGTVQTDLLALVWNTWNMQETKKPKKIISFGSLVTDMHLQTILEMNDFTYFNRQREKSEYIAEKLMLEKVHNEYKNLHLTGYKKDYCLPQTILVKLGNVLYKDIRSHEPHTNEDQLLEVVDYVVNSKSYISDIEVRWD